MPKVSVIVPVYNGEQVLQRCISSLLAQTYTDFEVLLVDDGSNDNTWVLCEKLQSIDTRVRIFHKSNGGVSSARNFALDRSSGEYVTFADADDYVLPCWLEAFINTIENTQIAIQGMHFISGEYDLIRNIKPIHTQRDVNNLILNLLEYAYLGYTPGKMFRKDIIKSQNLRFDESIRFREDDVFVLQYLEYVDSWAYTDQANYIYFAPSGDKNYGTSATDCTELVFRSLYKIFNGRIPDEIKRHMAWSVKGAAIERLLDGKRLSPELIGIYKDVIPSFSNDFKSKLVNNLVVHSPKYGVFSSAIIKMIHKMK